MARAAGEMPFLDHLEELRSRILRSLLAVIACFGLGLWLVNRFRLVDVLKEPIARYLEGGQLTVKFSDGKRWPLPGWRAKREQRRIGSPCRFGKHYFGDFPGLDESYKPISTSFTCLTLWA